MNGKFWCWMGVFCVLLLMLCACSDDSSDPDGDVTDGDTIADGDSTEGESVDGDSEVDGDTTEGEISDGDLDYAPVENLLPPSEVFSELGFAPPAREANGTAPNQEEITAFTKKVTAFFKETNYFDWVWRMSHGLDASYDSSMMDYKLWWQDVGMRREGDTIIFNHRGKAENILKRSIKVMSNAIAGYLLTGDERMAAIGTQYLKGIVALSLGLEFGSEDPLVKYLQARAVFNHDHAYTVDDRKVQVNYTPACYDSFKWNVHVFEIPDNPTYGDIWVSNMRSKDDVPYVNRSLPIATRAFHESQNQELRDAAELYIEYIRGFSKNIVDNDWFIMTKYEDGEAVRPYDATKPTKPLADLGSYVHWEILFGEDAECNAQLGAALLGYGNTQGKGDCGSGMTGWDFEAMAGVGNWFNYNIYNYFHIGALAAAEAWGHTALAESLMSGLPARFDTMMHDAELSNREHQEFQSDMSGWLLSAATYGYPLDAEEARHIMQWYGDSSDWYRQWEHWDPWATLPEDTDYSDYKAPRVEQVDNGQGGVTNISYVRLVEMPYIFEYCLSSVRDKQGVQFIDCDIVADPSKWGED